MNARRLATIRADEGVLSDEAFEALWLRFRASAGSHVVADELERLEGTPRTERAAAIRALVLAEAVRFAPRNLFEALALGLGDRWEPAGSDAPTSAKAGSREKLDVLAERAEDGLELWHEADNPELTDPDDEPEP